MTNACDPQKAAELLRALAHPMRLQILCRLLDGELSVAGFESELGLKQPNLSQQLGQLREVGLVATRREAKSIFYRLLDKRVQGILDALRLAVGAPDTPAAQSPAKSAPRAPAAQSSAKSAPPAPAAQSSAKSAPPAPAAQEPIGCGVFSTAGWPGEPNKRNGTRG